MGWVDSHCHLNFKQLNAPKLIPDLLDNGCEALLVPATELALFPDVIALKNQYPSVVYIALGLHPYFLSKHQEQHLQILDEQISRYKPSAVGEFGLDFMLDKASLEDQYIYFRGQVSLAKAYKLPLVIHCRKAHDQIASELKRVNFAHGGFIHGFSGSVQQAKRYLDLGFVLGLGGALTYDRAKAMHKMVAVLPDNAFSLETDSPDMSPAFARDEVNTPLNILKIAEYVAELRKQDVEEVLTLSRQTFYRVIENQ